MLEILLSELPPCCSILAGAILGESHAQIISTRIQEYGELPAVVLLSFKGVDALTASYLKEFLKPFAARVSGGIDAYPVFADIATDDLRYELRAYADAKGVVFQELRGIEGDGQLVTLIGDIERSARDAYEQLKQRGPSTAADLHEKTPDHRLSGQTTWNNRLMKLYELRLAHRNRIGRNWVYCPVPEL